MRTYTYTCARAQLASDGSCYVSVRVHICEYMCVFARNVSERERACIFSEKRKRDGEMVWGGRREERKDEGEFVRVSETRRVFIRKDGEWRKEGGRERVKLMYLFCGHPHMLSWAREGSAVLSREGLTAKRMAETTWPGST